MTRAFEEQIVKYLTDVHSIEEQALQQLRSAPDIAGDESLAAAFREHCVETEEQERRVRERLEQCGGDPSAAKDLIARAGGFGMLLFARSQPDTPGKLTAHAFSYEHMELAAYDLLALAAERGGDGETAALARSIRDQEEAMAARLAERFDRAVDASLQAVGADDLEGKVVDYLTDAHAIEGQAIKLMEKGPDIVGEDGLASLFDAHLEESRRHEELLGERIEALGGSPSALKDAVLRVGGLNMGGFFAAQPDTPAKLAGFAYAFEHLEIAAYEQLKRVAERAGDAETARLAETILAEEREAARRVRERFGPAIEASMEAQDVAV